MSRSELGRTQLAKEQAREDKHLDRAIRQQVKEDPTLAKGEAQHEDDVKKMEEEIEKKIDTDEPGLKRHRTRPSQAEETEEGTKIEDDVRPTPRKRKGEDIDDESLLRPQGPSSVP